MSPLFRKDRAEETPVPHAIPVPQIDEPDDDMYALVRRNPGGAGYAVVVGFIADDKIPEVDPMIHRIFMTLAGAVRFAQTAPLYSVHPECYRTQTKLLKGL